jgi:hypothetical protein
MLQVAQGDILLTQLSGRPDKRKVIKSEGVPVIVGFGETSGH